MPTWLRWILILPTALIAYFAVQIAVGLASEALPFRDDAQDFISQLANSLLGPWLFIRSGAKIAPRGSAVSSAIWLSVIYVAATLGVIGFLLVSGISAGHSLWWMVLSSVLSFVLLGIACIQVIRSDGGPQEYTSLDAERGELFIRSVNSYEAALRALKPFHDLVATWQSDSPSAYDERVMEEHSDAIERLATSFEVLTVTFDALQSGQSQATSAYKAAAAALEAAADSYQFLASQVLNSSLQQQINVLRTELDSTPSNGQPHPVSAATLTIAKRLEEAAKAASDRAESIQERARGASTYAMLVACRRRFKTDPPCRFKTDPGVRRPREVAVGG